MYVCKCSASVGIRVLVYFHFIYFLQFVKAAGDAIAILRSDRMIVSWFCC